MTSVQVTAKPTAAGLSSSGHVPSTGSVSPTILPDDPRHAWLHTPALQERDTVPDAKGWFRRIRLIRVEGARYPLIRVEQKRQKAAPGMEEVTLPPVAMVADHLMVKLDVEQTAAGLKKWAEEQGLVVRTSLSVPGVHLIEVPSGDLETYDRMLTALRPGAGPLRFAEPDFLRTASHVPNDPHISKQWGLHNLNGPDINAPEAWDITRGSAEVCVALLDSGVDYKHPDLAANIWKNPREKAGSKLDEDDNGYVDDVMGWDFVNNDADPNDDTAVSHGTKCAGVLGAAGDNRQGISGVCPVVRIMVLKCLDKLGQGADSDCIEAVYYARKQGADVLSISWGSYAHSQFLEDEFRALSVPVAAAAGNDAKNLDHYPVYPAVYCTAVAATTTTSVGLGTNADRLEMYSNYGPTTVKLGAPGSGIYTTKRNGGYDWFGGTSAATPHVAGAMALAGSLWRGYAQMPMWQNFSVGWDEAPLLVGKVITSGRLNLRKSLTLQDGVIFGQYGLSVVADGQASGTVGNRNGIISPGETVHLAVALRNVGTQMVAAGGSIVLALQSPMDGVEILRATSPLPTMAPGAAHTNSKTPFQVRISSSLVTPAQIPFHITFSGNAADPSSQVLDVQAEVVSMGVVSGKVTSGLTGKPVANATVRAVRPNWDPDLTGRVVKTMQTGADGKYLMTLKHAEYRLEAVAPAYEGAAASVVMPPAPQTVNLVLNQPQIVLSPTAITSTQEMEQVITKIVEIQNTGGAPLEVRVKPITDPAPGTAVLPFLDTFSGSETEWEPVYPSEPFILQDGRMTLNTPGSSNAGLRRSFSSGVRPSYAAYRMRARSANKRCGGFSIVGHGEVASCEAGPAGVLLLNGTATTVKYAAGVWQHIEFRDIDWVAFNFDFYVGGRLIRANVPFIKRVNALYGLQFLQFYNNQPGSEASWDDVELKGADTPWLTHDAPEVFTLAPAASRQVTVTLDSSGLQPRVYKGSLEVRSSDPRKLSALVPVTMTVVPKVNAAPVVAARTITLDEDAPTVITLTGTDADLDPLTMHLDTVPAAGSGMLHQTTDGITAGEAIPNGPASVTHPEGKVIYVPPAQKHGTKLASFTYFARDPYSLSKTAAVTLNVTSINDAPVARDDRISTLPGAALSTIRVLANDHDPEGEAMSITTVTQGGHGAVAILPDGQELTYTPAAATHATRDTFIYTVADSGGRSSTAMVVVGLEPLDGGDWPQAGYDAGRSSNYPARLGSGLLEEDWSLDIGFAATGSELDSVVVGGDRLYLLNARNRTLTMLGARSGLPLQAQTAPPGTLLYDQGRLYLAAAWTLFCHDAANLQPLWQGTCLQGTYGAVLSEGMILTIDSYSQQRNAANKLVMARRFQATSADTGDAPWTVQKEWKNEWYVKMHPPTTTGWFMTVAGEGSAFISFNGQVQRLDLKTGKDGWSATSAKVTSAFDVPSMALKEGRLYVGHPQGLQALSAAKGGFLWKKDTTSLYRPLAASSDGVWGHEEATAQLKKWQATTGVEVTLPTAVRSEAAAPVLLEDVVIANAQTNGGQAFTVLDRTTGAVRGTGSGRVVAVAAGGVYAHEQTNGRRYLRRYVPTTSGNARPQAVAQTVTLDEDTEALFTLGGTDADADPLTFTLQSLPLTGTLYHADAGGVAGAQITQVPVAVPSGKLIYRSPANQFGNPYASLTFRAFDGRQNSLPAQVTFDVRPVNDAPVAVADYHVITAGQTVAFQVTPNDTDIDQDVLTLVSVEPGTPSLSARIQGGRVAITAAHDLPGGVHTFAYEIEDAAGAQSEGVMNLEVLPMQHDGWVGNLNGARHTHFQLGVLGNAPFTQVGDYSDWTYGAPGAVVGGKIATSWYRDDYSSGERFAVIDSVTAVPSWRQTRKMFNAWWDAGSFVFGSNDQMVSVDPLTGQDVPSGVLSSVSGWKSVCDGHLFVAFSGGLLKAWNRDSGQLRFTRIVSDGSFSSLLFEDAVLYKGRLFVAIRGTPLTIRELNTQTGADLWSVTSMPAGVGRLFTDNDRLLCLQADNTYGHSYESTPVTFQCVDLRARQTVWTKTLITRSMPAVAHGKVFVAVSYTEVRPFDLFTGEVAGADYVLPNSYSFVYTPLVTEDSLICGNGFQLNRWSGATSIFDLETRQIRTTLPYCAPLAYADETLHIGGLIYRRVPAGNTAPTALAAAHTITEDVSTPLRLTATDAQGHDLSFALRSLPAYGKLYQTLDGITKGSLITQVPAHVHNTEGWLIYEPLNDHFGADLSSFKFTAHDRWSASTEVVVTLSITPVDDAPVAVADLYLLKSGSVLRGLNPVENDWNTDREVLGITAFTQPAHGSVTQGVDGLLTYVSQPGFTGEDTFEYTVGDSTSNTSSAVVTVRIGDLLEEGWPTPLANNSRNSFQPSRLGVARAPLTERWSKLFPNSGLSDAPRLLAGGGLVYSMMSDHAASETSWDHFMAYDPLTGVEQWRWGNAGPDQDFGRSAVYSAGLIYLRGSLYGPYYTVDTLVRNSSTGAHLISITPPYQYGRLAAAGGFFYETFDYGIQRRGLSGNPVPLGSWDQYNSAEPTLHNGRLYSYVYQRLEARDALQGTKLWELVVVPQVYQEQYNYHQPVCHGKWLVLRHIDQLVCVDTDARTVAWRVPGNFSSVPVIAHSMVMIGETGKPHVAAYDLTTGRLMHHYLSGNPQISAYYQLIACQDALVATGDANVDVFELSTRICRQTITGGSEMIIAGDTLYVSSGRNKFTAYSTTGAGNQVPQALTGEVTGTEDTDLEITLPGSDADGDAMTAVIRQLPASGTLYQRAAAGGRGNAITVTSKVTDPQRRVIYRAPQDAFGTAYAKLGFLVADATDLSAPAEITIHLTEVNDPPLVQDDGYHITFGKSLEHFQPMLNDLEQDGQAMSLSSFTQPSVGQVTSNADGTLSYDPAGAAAGTSVTFICTVSDSGGATSNSTVKVNVVAADQLPNWGHPNADVAHTRHYPHTMGNAPFDLKWTFAMPEDAARRTLHSPTGGNGTVLVTESDWQPGTGNSKRASIWHLDLLTGGILSEEIRGPNTQSYGYPAPAVWDAGNEAHMVPMSHMNLIGDTRTQVTLGDATSVPLLADNKCWWVEAGNLRGVRVKGPAFTAFTNSLFLTGTGTVQSISYQNGRIYAVNSLASGLAFRCYNATNGYHLWSVLVPGFTSYYDYISPIQISGNFAVFCARDSSYEPYEIFCVDLDARQVKWRRANVSYTHAVAGGIVYVLSNGTNTVQALHLPTGTLLRTYSHVTNSSFDPNLLVTEDMLICSSRRNAPVLISLSSGQLLQTLNAQGQLSMIGGSLFLTDYSSIVQNRIRCFAQSAAVSGSSSQAFAGLDAASSAIFGAVSAALNMQSTAVHLAQVSGGDPDATTSLLLPPCHLELSATPGQVTLRWLSEVGRNYSIECSADQETWNPWPWPQGEGPGTPAEQPSEPSQPIPGTGAEMTFNLPASAAAHWFYRIRVVVDGER